MVSFLVSPVKNILSALPTALAGKAPAFARRLPPKRYGVLSYALRATDLFRFLAVSENLSVSAWSKGLTCRVAAVRRLRLSHVSAGAGTAVTNRDQMLFHFQSETYDKESISIFMRAHGSKSKP
jgi:hypothetical protein